MSISTVDVDAVTLAAQALPPAKGNYLEPDFVMNVLATVIDYQTQTRTVERALEHFRRERWDEIRTFDDLEHCCKRFPDDKDGNTAFAQYLWGYNMWTRAEQLRGLIAFFWRHGITNQEALRDWAQRSNFKTDFEGKVKGLGPAVYNWLVMRQGVETVKPDVHVRRFAETAVGRRLNDQEIVDVVVQAAHRLGVPAYELDWAIWEAGRRVAP